MATPATNLNAWSKIFKQLFDPSLAQAVLLDLDGVILQTNLAWQQFGNLNGMPAGYRSIGQNYLQICESAAGGNEPGAQDAYIGLLEVIRTQRPKFTMMYPCHSPAERRWFRMWVEPQLPQVPAIVVAHYLRRTKPVTTQPENNAVFAPKSSHETGRYCGCDYNSVSMQPVPFPQEACIGSSALPSQPK